MAAPRVPRKRSRKPTDSLTSLPNIGGVTAAQLRKIGITTRTQFLRRDPYEIFDALLRKVDPTLCRSALAGIVGAKKGVRWNLVSRNVLKNTKRGIPATSGESIRPVKGKEALS